MSRTILLAAMGWAMIGADVVAEEPGRLPQPPMQGQPWTPPKADVPAALIDAARVLFDQGLADPRGCGYRQVELAGEIEERQFLLRSRPGPTIHAFVLPFDVKDGPRYAVAWNGLVYPVTKLGPAADLDADILALKGTGGASVKGGPPRTPGFFFAKDPIRGGRGASDLESASQGLLSPMKGVLLLRLGRGDLAEIVWKIGMKEPNRERGADVSDIYAHLVGEWEWALFSRAALAHERGDDPLALATIRELVRVRSLVAKRSPEGPAPPETVYPNFIELIPRLLADQERRARERLEPPPQRPAPNDRKARIAALIRNLDEVRMSRRGVLYSITGHPNFRAVVAEGDAAVGPLIDCLEHDFRLTRAIQTWRDAPELLGSSRFIRIHGVGPVAFQALAEILGTDDFGPWPPEIADQQRRPTRAEYAAHIRAFWEKNRDLGELDRLFARLADDKATSEQWLDAAEALTQPGDLRGRGRPNVIPHRPVGKVSPFRGEPLRSRKNPSVTELMALRTRQIDARGDQSDWELSVSNANGMAGILAAWDLRGAVPTLRDRVARAAEILRRAPPDEVGIENLAAEIARFTVLRVKGGDSSALADYATWVRKRPRPVGFGHFRSEMFEPLWRYPDDPAIASASRALFEDPASPWVPLFGPNENGWGDLGWPSDLINSPMLGVAPFRKLVLAGLADNRPAGSLDCDEAGKVQLRLDKNLFPFPAFREDDPDRLQPGTSMPFRVSDKFAWKLQQVAGLPRFVISWPLERRDQAIAAIVAVLARYGERFRTTEISQSFYERGFFYPRQIRPMLAFEPLDHPATADDVSAGRAIFSVGPGVEVRRWPMPSFPLEATWNEMPIPPGEFFLRPKEPLPPKDSFAYRWAQRGLVWQSEEVREGSRWRRYYGLVGRDVIARIPAEEVDFPAPRMTGWTQVSRDLEARLIASGPIVLMLRNHRGIEVDAPTDLIRPGAVPSLRDGLTIRLLRRPDSTEPERVAGLGHRSTIRPAPLLEVAARREPERHRSSSKTTLAPTATAEALRLDLDTFYGPLSPGGYRVEVEFGDIKASQDITIE